MPKGDNKFSVGNTLNIRVYDLSYAEHADDLNAEQQARVQESEVYQVLNA